ncbi:MAG: DNA mismatch repair endonuclease MutL [Isosphaeraceae bacterium]
MGIIRELSASVINQIAAGEVVERPASVVKELLENAIDAGASRVELTVERGGKDLVRVADDGKGMDRDDLLLAFRPHATSKLSGADDLFRISTLGFRGEALAAIAEVSKVRCQSRTAEADAGSELVIEGGEASPLRDCGCPVGTVIEVRNLFYNTPVRRTFLKSDSTEAGHVVDMFTRIALAHPTVHMTYRSSNKVVYDLPAVTGIKERVAVFFGQELADSLLWVESRLESIHLWGYVAHPAQSRSTAKGQFLFIGGRYVRDRSLSHALSEAYRGLLMVGRMPVAFLYLEVPPEDVDVNVHPTKIEVRFRDSHRIYSQVLSTIRQTFLSSDLHARLQAPPPEPEPRQPARTQAVDFSLAGSALNRQTVASWFASTDPTPGFQTFPNPGYAGGPVAPSVPREWVSPLPPQSTIKDAGPFDEFASPTGQEPAEPPSSQPTAIEPAKGGRTPGAIQVHDSYLIAETDEGMIVIDQHALHERILYEELKARLERGGVEGQRLLVPEPIDLSGSEAAEVLQYRDLLARLGIGVEPFGGDTVLVTSTPVMLAHVPPDRLLRDLAEHIHGKPLPPTPDAMLEDVLNMVACKAAVKAGQRLSAEEVAALLERRHLAANTHHCPHGRPTALTFTKAELERQFGRI